MTEILMLPFPPSLSSYRHHLFRGNLRVVSFSLLQHIPPCALHVITLCCTTLHPFRQELTQSSHASVYYPHFYQGSKHHTLR